MIPRMTIKSRYIHQDEFHRARIIMATNKRLGLDLTVKDYNHMVALILAKKAPQAALNNPESPFEPRVWIVEYRPGKKLRVVFDGTERKIVAIFLMAGEKPTETDSPSEPLPNE